MTYIKGGILSAKQINKLAGGSNAGAVTLGVKRVYNSETSKYDIIGVDMTYEELKELPIETIVFVNLLSMNGDEVSFVDHRGIAHWDKYNNNGVITASFITVKPSAPDISGALYDTIETKVYLNFSADGTLNLDKTYYKEKTYKFGE